MERKLATIRKVNKLIPIIGADRIETAQVDGWQCVVKKGEFTTNDLGVYFEIDSLLPEEKKYEFLRHGNSLKKLEDGSTGYRLKTVRLRKTLSQGLLMPLSTFSVLKNPKLGDDVTEILNIKKYELRVSSKLISGPSLTKFPPFVHKTDQERIQNLVTYFDKMKNVEFEETEKLDGSSLTIYYNHGKFGVCSRNLELRETEKGNYWQMVRELQLHKQNAHPWLRWIKQFLNPHINYVNINIAIQGELIGEGIQKNPLKIKGHQFRVFDIFLIDKHRYAAPQERFEILLEYFPKLQTVPLCTDYGNPIKIFNKCSNINELLEHVKGKSIINPKSTREGSVFKAINVYGSSIVSFKLINNDYLEGK